MRLAQSLANVKSSLRESLRAFLVRRGVALFRLPRGASLPPKVDQYLKKLFDRGTPLDRAFSFDAEPQMQKELLGRFAADRVLFVSPQALRQNGSALAAALQAPTEPFLAEIDCESFNLEELAAALPWLLDADVILLRATLGYFWSGNGDLARLVCFLEKRGFKFFDALEYFKLHLLTAPLGRIVFAFERPEWRRSPRQNGDGSDAPRVRRINEALTFLSTPIARSAELRQLAGRGSFGFEAGVLNPGAIAQGDNILLLARGEHVPWAISKRSVSGFLRGWQPVLFELNSTLSITSAHEAALLKANGARLEDFRLFRYGDQLFSNHSTVLNPGRNGAADEAVQLESLQIRVGISRVDTRENALTFVDSPAVDFPLNGMEKNWAFFEHQKALYLIYNFHPFHLLRATRWPELNFATVTRRRLAFPHGDDGVPFRNSANPVEYDQDHFLHMVHKVYPYKQYVFWAVLIDKTSLMPKMISAHPLVCGWKSAPASIIYACSLIVRNGEIIVFGGLDDSALGVWRIRRTELEENWVALAGAEETKRA